MRRPSKLRPKLPVGIRPDSDCNGLVNRHWPGNLRERRLFDFLIGRTRPSAAIRRIIANGCFRPLAIDQVASLDATLSTGAEVKSAARYATRDSHNCYRSPLGVLIYGPACEGSSRIRWRIALGILQHRGNRWKYFSSYGTVPYSFLGSLTAAGAGLTPGCADITRVVEEHANNAAVA